MILPFRFAGVFALAVLCATSVSLAQDDVRSMPPRPPDGAPPGEAPGGGRPNADPMEMLINSTTLQSELGIDETQLHKLRSIQGPFLTRQAELIAKMRGGPAQAAAARSELRAHMEMGRAMVARVLTRPQLNRLQQIMMQVGGVCVTVRDENASQALQIDPSQMRRISVLCQEMNQFAAPVPRNADPRQMCAASRAAAAAYEGKRAEVEKEVLSLLSDGQIASLNMMRGRPFQMDPPIPPECQ